MTVTRFDGTSLPAGWSAVEPTGGHVVVGNGYLSLNSDAGSDFDSLSSGITSPQGPRASLPLTGSFDIAIGIANATNCAENQGVEILAWDQAATRGIRWTQFIGEVANRDVSWFARRQTSTNANVTLTATPSALWGPRSWMRLTRDASTNTWTLRSSQTGKPGTWHTHATFTDAFAQTSIELTMTAAAPDANARSIRIAVFVDMTDRADDATTEPGAVTRTTVFDADLSGVALPPGLTSEVNASGSVVVADGYARLSTATATLDSYAWLIGPTDLATDHGVLIRYRFPQPSVQNSFAAIIIRGAETTDLPAGSQVLPDKYRPGTGLLAEVNGDAASFGDIIRILTAHATAVGETFDGTQEFYGFSMMIEDLTADVDGGTGGWIWARLESVGGYHRSRWWLDGNAEPSTWTYEGEDHTQRGTAAFVTFSHNDSTSGGTSTFDVNHYELYELSEASAALTVADAVHEHAADSVTLTQHHVLTVAGAAHVHAAEAPALTQHHVLTVADAVHVHAADNVALGTGDDGSPDLDVTTALILASPWRGAVDESRWNGEIL